MSMTGYMCERFEEEVAKLVKEAQQESIDGISVAGILQHAATKMLKQCHEGTDRYQACLAILDEARRDFIEDAVAKAPPDLWTLTTEELDTLIAEDKVPERYNRTADK